jgi:hypothetical protein
MAKASGRRRSFAPLDKGRFKAGANDAGSSLAPTHAETRVQRAGLHAGHGNEVRLAKFCWAGA